MIRVTFSTQQQQVTVRIICNIEGLGKHYFPNDFINVLLLSGRQCYAYQYPIVVAGRNIQEGMHAFKPLKSCLIFLDFRY
jgi:hypothetical protein